MSWFGETFGDSLSSLKGQITKITKEVLAEDDNDDSEHTSSPTARLKELEALCSSKDLEIANLREENLKILQRFQEELKFLRNENKKLKSDGDRSPDEMGLLNNDGTNQISKLESQLQQLRIERDHLEELQKDHQSNIFLVMQQRDNFRQELHKLQADYSELNAKYNEIVNKQKDRCTDDNLLEIDLNPSSYKDDETENLRNTVDKLIQVEFCDTEKEESLKVIEQYESHIKNLKDEMEKLMNEVIALNNENGTLRVENDQLKQKIETDLSNRMRDIEKEQVEKQELGVKLKTLTQMFEANKVEQSNLKLELETEITKLLQIFFPSEKSFENISLPKLVTEIENVWGNNLREKEKAEIEHKEYLLKLENEIQKLKTDKTKVEDEMKIQNDKHKEIESNYEMKINSLQSEFTELKSKGQECVIKSQIDDVKKLEEEVTHLEEVLASRNKELDASQIKISELTDQVNATKTMSESLQCDLRTLNSEMEQLNVNISHWKSECENRDLYIQEMGKTHEEVLRKCQVAENEKAKMQEQVDFLQDELNKLAVANREKEETLQMLQKSVDRASVLEKELEISGAVKGELEQARADIQELKNKYHNDVQCLKAELIVNESKGSELIARNKSLMDEINALKGEIVRLQPFEEELNKWKEATVELEIQRQDLAERRELLEKENASLRSAIEGDKERVNEAERLKSENLHLSELCDKLQHEIQSKAKSEKSETSEVPIQPAMDSELENLKAIGQQQANAIASLTYENNDLRHHLKIAGERLAELNAQNNELKERNNSETELEEAKKRVASLESQINCERMNVLQHRRSRSAADCDTAVMEDADNSLRLEIGRLKEQLQLQQVEYKNLDEKYMNLVEKESHSKRELERLRLHLIEIENDYTETIDEYKTKLGVVEEQLKNSSTFYTSTKVRDNQHLESLQSQVRLISAQRDDLQVKLSTAEDEVQRHKAALTSFHVVLQQFQQDKERDLESMAAKYENQLMLSENRFAELHQEISSLNNQLSDAKNGLKAASRLGEQLERKTQQILELEKSIADMKSDMKEMKEREMIASQSSVGKVDKSLVKNLLVGYISSQKADQKEQVLRIMMSVLEFDDEERSKIALDNTHSGWLANLLHPKGDGSHQSQSLSEAFIRFLENESQPQPQLKLLPERVSPKGSTGSRPSSTTPKPSLLLQELVLPTFSSPQSSESTILKDVLNDS